MPSICMSNYMFVCLFVCWCFVLLAVEVSHSDDCYRSTHAHTKWQTPITECSPVPYIIVLPYLQLEEQRSAAAEFERRIQEGRESSEAACRERDDTISSLREQVSEDCIHASELVPRW